MVTPLHDRRPVDSGVLEVGLIGICTGVLFVVAAAFWIRAPVIPTSRAKAPPSRDLGSQASATPSTPLATSMLRAHFHMGASGHHLTWIVENVGKLPITSLHLTLFDQRYRDRRIEAMSLAVLAPGESATQDCEWYGGPPAVNVDAATVGTGGEKQSTLFDPPLNR